MHDIITEAVRFASVPYSLEGELLYPESDPAEGLVLVAGPHPMLGGDMQNNVVRGISEGLASAGFVVLRFNYRGIGNSTGPTIDVHKHLAQFWETSQAPNETDFRFDVRAAWDFLLQAVPVQSPRIAIGYSFGCTLLPELSNSNPPEARVAIAPTLGKHDYSSYRLSEEPLLAIAPTDDFASQFSEVESWFATIAGPKQLVPTQRDGHFFRGHEEWLTATILSFLHRPLEKSLHDTR